MVSDEQTVETCCLDVDGQLQPRPPIRRTGLDRNSNRHGTYSTTTIPKRRPNRRCSLCLPTTTEVQAMTTLEETTMALRCAEDEMFDEAQLAAVAFLAR